MAVAVGRPGRHAAGEQRGPNVAEIEDGSAHLGEADGRQVDLAGQLGEAPGGNFVDLEAWEALHLAVTLLGAVIDIVVAERTEVESGERVQRLPPSEAAARIEPDR